MAEPTAHTETPAGHGAFPPFQAEHFPSQLLWLTVSFVLLYVLMSKVALPRIGSILADRNKRIGDDLAAAQRLKEQADAAHAAYDKALADARNRAQSIANATREKHAREAEAIQKKLESELHDKLTAAERSIATTRTAAMGNVRSIAADTVSAIVERLIGKAPAEHEIAAALGDLGKR
jgi:F-type H+-transporting ATPase subunit b